MQRYTAVICDLFGTLVPNHGAVAARAAVFSCRVGLRKPHPRLYQLACEALGAEGGKTLYLGDGGSDELNGAVKAGLDAVQIVWEFEDDETARLVKRPAWSGARISSIDKLIETIWPA